MKNECFQLVSGLLCSGIEQMRHLPLGKYGVDFFLWGDTRNGRRVHNPEHW